MKAAPRLHPGSEVKGGRSSLISGPLLGSFAADEEEGAGATAPY